MEAGAARGAYKREMKRSRLREIKEDHWREIKFVLMDHSLQW